MSTAPVTPLGWADRDEVLRVRPLILEHIDGDNLDLLRDLVDDVPTDELASRYTPTNPKVIWIRIWNVLELRLGFSRKQTVGEIRSILKDALEAEGLYE